MFFLVRHENLFEIVLGFVTRHLIGKSGRELDIFCPQITSPTATILCFCNFSYYDTCLTLRIVADLPLPLLSVYYTPLPHTNNYIIIFITLASFFHFQNYKVRNYKRIVVKHFFHFSIFFHNHSCCLYSFFEQLTVAL